MKVTRNNRSAKALAQSRTTTTKQDTAAAVTNLNEKMTLRELLTLIKSTAGLPIPTAKALRTTDYPVAIYSTDNFSITVYSCGFALAQSYKRTTVVRVDACGDYKYQTLHEKIADTKKSATPTHIGKDVFLDAAWPVRIMLTAEDQLERNNDGVARNAISKHADALANNPMYSGRYDDSAEDIVIKKMEKEEMLSTLTDKQREAYVLYYDEGYTMQEIGEMLGISRDAVKDRIHAVQCKISKYKQKNGD